MAHANKIKTESIVITEFKILSGLKLLSSLSTACTRMRISGVGDGFALDCSSAILYSIKVQAILPVALSRYQYFSIHQVSKSNVVNMNSININN